MIPYGKQSINDDDLNAVLSVLKSDWLTTGPEVGKFEAAIQRITKSAAVAVSSGTAALHAAYAAIGLLPGDEVITPPLTFVATQATAKMFGAEIVFCDVEEDTGNLDPNLVDELITDRTKAVVAVDYAGHPAELDDLLSITRNRGIFLIEDAAHSIASTYRNRPVGSIADLTTLSFFPTKNITTGEGGAVVSNDSDLLQRAREFSRQGLIRDKDRFLLESHGEWHQEVHNFGLNYRLPDILCALGSSQLTRIEEFKHRRSEIFSHYSLLLDGLQGVRLPAKRAYVDPMWHLFPIRVNPSDRRRIFEGLRARGIGVQVNYIPAYRHPAFKDSKTYLKNAENFYESEISLPMHVELSNKEIEYVAENLRSLL